MDTDKLMIYNQRSVNKQPLGYYFCFWDGLTVVWIK